MVGSVGSRGVDRKEGALETERAGVPGCSGRASAQVQSGDGHTEQAGDNRARARGRVWRGGEGRGEASVVALGGRSLELYNAGRGGGLSHHCGGASVVFVAAEARAQISLSEMV
jgi:hypothetical protein